mmetsp:Transcript_30215/g.92824  ORF Transcript_30215/g.92824 Transcript_30215/m.92824 type:complete len:498 (+) Transcript_30215:52-1545(+)
MVSQEPGAAAGRKVVVDAGAAIKLQRLERFGGELYTTGGVIREIRDERARALLRTLPQELRVREAASQDIAFVKQFAKATGDLGFLSQNDIELIALTVGLHREDGGTVRQKPQPLVASQGQSAFDWAPGAAKRPSGPASQAAGAAAAAAPGDVGAGAKAPAAGAEDVAPERPEPAAEAAPGEEGEEAPGRPHELTTAVALSVLRSRANSGDAPPRELDSEPAPEPTPSGAAAPEVPPAPAPAPTPAAAPEPATADAAQPAPAAGAAAAPAAAGEEEDAWSEDGSSAGEWVTEENMHRFGMGVEPAADSARVTCATADYSVQNVLLQMGITPQTFDGYAVRTVKLWGLVCRACFFFTRDTQRVFCPKCGNDTVVRTPLVVGEDGQMTVLHNGRKLRTKGTIYSVPKPTGGRGWQPIFAEDEMRMGGRDRQLRHQQRLSEKDRQSRDPFNEDNGARAWYQRNTTSTGKALNGEAPRIQAGYGRRNPNANNFKFKAGKRR